MLTFSELPPPSPSSPNSSTKDSWIKKIYITEYTEYAENINIYTECSLPSLIISDHPQVSGWEMSLSIVRLMNLLHFRNLMALKVWQNLIASALAFQGKDGASHPRKQGLSQCFLNHTRKFIQTETKTGKITQNQAFTRGVFWSVKPKA